MIDQRIYLFGASNLWFSRHAALTEVRRRFPGRLEIGLACGPGRAYGLAAGNPVARYHALKDVVFQESSEVPTLAILSDVGNDIAYGQPPERVVNWVAELAQRLEDQGVEVVVTGVPVETLKTLHPVLFALMLRMYFVGAGDVTQSHINGRLEALEDGLREMCQDKGYIFLDTQPDWYGPDRFHLRPSAFQGCWQHWLGRLSPATPQEHRPLSWAQTVKLRPADYWFFGKAKGARGFYPSVLEGADIHVR